MRITYLGTGTVTIERVGEIRSGQSITAPDDIGRALVKQDPSRWREDRPAPRVKGKKGGGV